MHGYDYNIDFHTNKSLSIGVQVFLELYVSISKYHTKQRPKQRTPQCEIILYDQDTLSL